MSEGRSCATIILSSQVKHAVLKITQGGATYVPSDGESKSPPLETRIDTRLPISPKAPAAVLPDCITKGLGHRCEPDTQLG
jgi:hypothetical protein